MATISRPPGDTSPKTLSRSANYSYSLDGSTDSGSTTYLSDRNVRPGYSKGGILKLPNGSDFIRPTAYTVQQWSVGNFSPARIEGSFLGKTHRAVDHGRDGSRFLSGNPTLVGANSIPTDARNEAVTKALNKIGDQKVNLAENLATFGQTARLFAGKVGAIVDLAKAARNRREWQKYLYKSARDLGREGVVNRSARLYIEYVYGFKPLMQDAYALGQLLKDGSVEDYLIGAHGSANRTDFRASDPLISASYSTQQRLNWTSEYRVRTALWARLDPNWGGMRSLNQLGLINPLSLAWELVPWSFVVDWFLPIGPVMQALSAPAGLIFVGGSNSIRNRESHQIEYHIKAGNYRRENLRSTPALVPVSFDGYRRETITSWPRPGLWVDTDPLRGDRIFKALALAILTFGKSRPPIN